MAGYQIRCAWDSFSRREHRCRPGRHRPDCGGSTPPSRSRSLRVPPGLQTLTAKSRLLTGEKCLHKATSANPRQPTIVPMWLSSDRCLRTATALPREAHWWHASALSVGSISASVVKLLSSSPSNGEFAGGSPAGCTKVYRRVSPNRRGVPLKTERLQVPCHADQPSLCRASARQANLECQPDERAGPRC